MTLEEKINYYNWYYADEDIRQLPDNLNTKEFFSIDFLEWLLGKDEYNSYNFKVIWNKELKDLFKIAYDDSRYMDIVTRIFLMKDVHFNQKQFDYIMNYKSMSEKFMQMVIKYINNDLNSIKSYSKNLIFSNQNLLSLILNIEIINIDFLKFVFDDYMFKKSGIKKDFYLTLLLNENFKKAFLNLNYLDFFDFINEFSLEKDIPELINDKIQTLKYEEIITLLEKKYDVINKKPEYLNDLYDNYEEEIKKDKIKRVLCNQKIDSNEELKENIRNILNTKDGMDVFLSEIIEPRFSKILNVLNMENDYKILRKNNLLNKLNNYEQYNLDTIKNLFSLYCFDDISYNTILRLKTLIEYAKEDDEIQKKYSNEIAISTMLYNFLSSNDLTINPIELVKYCKNFDINLIIKELHSKFSHDVNKKTDILNKLDEKVTNYKIIDDLGVKIYDLSNLPIEQSYFLIHSVSISDLGNNMLEKYTNSSEKHNRICMSLFDNNHITSFLKGNVIVFGYCNISNPIYSATTFDGQTNQRATFDFESKPQYRSTLTNIEKFMDRTNPESYNELTYFTNKKIVMPSYIFVSNRKPTEIEGKIAKEFNIPIVIYYTKQTSFKYEDDYEINNHELFDYDKFSINIIPNNIKENKKKL